jgi:ATP-dependent Clp protease ATP-binding subunit ClpA
VIDTTRIHHAFALAKHGLHAGPEPVGAFMLTGPTGSGKTHLVRSLAKQYHGDEKCLVRINCGEFQLEHEGAKLVGAPPGYLGHCETPPLITNKSLNANRSDACGLAIVLWDEIEKGAASLYRLLLGILDAGTLTTGDGQVVHFTNTVHFMTSNLRPATSSIGLAPRSATSNSESRIRNTLRQWSSPEFVNRLTAVYEMPAFTFAECFEIATAMSAEIAKELSSRAIGWVPMRPAASLEQLTAWAQLGMGPEGARPMRRAIKRHWELYFIEAIEAAQTRATPTARRAKGA